MIRMKPEHEVCRPGERYLDEVAGPVRVGRYIHRVEPWVYYFGTVQERPCEIRMASIRDELLCGGYSRAEAGSTVVTLVREARPPE
ncbi:hypothetical protein EQ832_22125 [Pseudomonas sp. ALS1131]|nr:hypothetical protein [Pseudomonas sp. ALS1131]TRO33325.1 hypothetical protein EQ832_22125 [Pseudomonas sp. ALS1131]